MNNEIKQLILEIEEFSKERDWDQFHNPKDIAIALSIEASELLEVFLWKNPEDAKIEKVRLTCKVPCETIQRFCLA